jgi:MFS family permease
LFFAELKFTDFQIGLFMTLTLLGDVFLGLFLTIIADRVGRRRILFAGSGLMVMSGLLFSYFENFWILLLAAIVGGFFSRGILLGLFTEWSTNTTQVSSVQPEETSVPLELSRSIVRPIRS